jgi:putative methyltransferase (TIGR04325 family)
MNQPIPLFDQGTIENLVLQNRENLSNDVWSSSRWVKRQQEFLTESLEGTTPRPHSFRELLEFIAEPLNIVDFGGGSGWLFHTLLFSGINVQSYVNVESINLHDTCNQRHSNYFYLTPEELETHCWNSDNYVLYFNSVIQYFESDNSLFEILKKISPKTVLIDDLTPSASNQFFAYQKYYETRIPYRFIDQNALIKGMTERGYNLRGRPAFSRVISPAFSYAFEKADDRFSIGETNSLIFERTKDL